MNPSAEARASADAFRARLAPVVEVAACRVNLRGLVREYARTARRARSIENAFEPEIDAGLNRALAPLRLSLLESRLGSPFESSRGISETDKESVAR